MTLTWTAPGDNWLCGRADRFRVLLAAGPIESPGDGERARTGEASAAAGEEEGVTLSAAEARRASHAAVLYRDEAGNWGLLRAVRIATQAPGPPNGGDRDGDRRDGDDRGPDEDAGEREPSAPFASPPEAAVSAHVATTEGGVLPFTGLAVALLLAIALALLCARVIARRAAGRRRR